MSWSEPVTRPPDDVDDVDLELQTRQQEQKRLEEQLSQRLARLRETSSPHTLVPPLPRPRLPREGPSPPTATTGTTQPCSPPSWAPWQMLEETIERVARLESCCLATVPAMRVQLNHLEQRFDSSGRVGTFVDAEMQSLRDEWQVLMTSLRRDLLSEVAKLDSSLRGRLSVLVEELQSMRQGKSSMLNAEELAKRAAQVAESNSSTLEQVKVLKETLELGIKSEIAGVQGLFDDLTHLKGELTSSAAEDRQHLASALAKLQVLQEEVASSSEEAKTFLRDGEVKNKSVEDRCKQQQEMHAEVEKDLKNMEMQMARCLGDSEAQTARLEVTMKDALRSEMRNVDDAAEKGRVEVERQERQLATLRSDLEGLRGRFFSESEELQRRERKTQETILEWRSSERQSVEELKNQLQLQLEDLSQGCASAKSGAEVARRLANGVKVNVEELIQRQEHAESRFTEEVQEVKRNAQAERAERLVSREEVKESISEQRKALRKLDSEYRSEWQELVTAGARHREEWSQWMREAQRRMDTAIQQGQVQSREVERQLQHLAKETTLTVQKGQDMLKDFEGSLEARSKTQLELCQSTTMAATARAQKDVEVLVAKMQGDVSWMLRKAEEQFCDTKGRADAAQAAYDLAAAAAADAEAARCAVEAKLSHSEAELLEFREALERQCGKHRDLCSSQQEDIKALSAQLREEWRMRCTQLDRETHVVLEKVEKQVCEARSQAEEAEAACHAATSSTAATFTLGQNVQEDSRQFKEFVAEQQRTLVQCFKELAKVALACSISSLGTGRGEVGDETTQQLTETLRAHLTWQDSQAVLDEVRRNSQNLGGLVAHLAGTLTQLRSLLPEAEAAEATATLPEVHSPVSEGPWHEVTASPTSPGTLRVALESRPPRPPSLVIAWPGRE